MENKKNPLHETYGLAKDWYNKNVVVRQSLEQEWREAAQLTLPYVFPSEDSSEESLMPTPFNSVGAAGVNTLASKLLLTLLPPTGVFFRLLPDTDIVADLAEEEVKQLDADLATVENDVIEYVNQKALRVPVYEAIKLLEVTGNAMLYKVPKGGIKVFSPYQYVVQRDYVGNILTQCILEKMDRTSLPIKVLKQLEAKEGEACTKEAGEKAEVLVYTMIVSTGPNKFKVWQEIEDTIIDNTEKEYTNTTLPYITLRWTTVNNESYGRGLVSQYLGDLRSLEGLTQSIVEGAGISAMHLFGLRPGSTLKIEDLNNAKNGAFVLGDLEREVSVLQINKGADLQVPLQLISQLEQRLSKAFMMMSGQVRDSERTTATEVRATAAELEATLGGVFSVLANEFQTPLITLILQELNPAVLKVATPSITTGISAISRERDFTNLNTMLQSIAQLGPDVIGQYLNIPAYLSQIAVSLGMAPESIVKSQEQIQEEQKQQQEAMMQEQVMQTGQQMIVDTNKQGGK